MSFINTVNSGLSRFTIISVIIAAGTLPAHASSSLQPGVNALTLIDERAACVLKRNDQGDELGFPVDATALDQFLAAGFTEFLCPKKLNKSKSWGKKFCKSFDSSSEKRTLKIEEFIGMSHVAACSAILTVVKQS